ncbi:MAG: T9SS type A sorting domain-containing protein [Bacteroidota bacterium]
MRRAIPICLFTFFILIHQLSNAQTVTKYAFSPSSSTFTNLVGGTVPTMEPGGTLDDGYFINLPIGFNFFYNSLAYTSLSASTNGFICLGQNITNQNSQANNLTTGGGTTSPRPIIAPLWDDIALTNASDISYLTTGTSPSRVFTIQYLNVKWDYSGSAAVSFQIKLYEADSKIEFYYSLLAGALTNPSASIGITNVGSGVGNFLSITSTGNNPFDTTSVTETTTLNTKPANGQKYSFIPKYILPAAPTALTFTSVTSTSMNVNWIDNTTSETYYKILVSTDNITFSPLATIYSTSILSTGTAYQYPLTGLTMGTTYYFKVYVGNEGSASTNFVSSSQSTISGVLTGTKTICPSGCDYTTLGLAASDIRSQGVNGNLILEMDATYDPAVETYPINFGNIITNASNTVTLRPRSNVTSMINFIWYGSNSQTLDFNSTKYLTIDGRKGGTGTENLINISNFNSSGTAVRFINDATNNVIKYCNISAATSSTSLGVITFASTSGTLGNSSNTITNCTIKDSISNPLYAIYSSGNSTYPNINNTITNNLIYDYFNSSNPTYGVYLTTGSDVWTISYNHFFQTVQRSLSFNTAGAVFSNFGASFTVSNNYIGGSAPFCLGSPMYYDGSGSTNLISLNLPTNGVCNIQDNVIRNIILDLTGVSNSLIYLANGAFNVTGNLLGNTTSTNNIRFTSSATNVLFSPILLSGGSSYGNINISSNAIGGISVAGTGTTIFKGINATVAVPLLTINNNIIGSLTTPNSITDSTNQVLYGISATLTSTSNTISGNIISNLTMPNTGTANQLCGIYANSTGTFSIIGNLVKNLSTNSTSITTGATGPIIGILHQASGSNQVCGGNIVNGIFSNNTSLVMAVTGIFYSGTSTGTNYLTRNFVHGIISQSSAASVINGIFNGSSNTNAINNMVRVGLDTSGNSINTNQLMYGINDAGNSNSYFNNSVYIAGSAVGAGANNSAAFFNSIASTGTRFIVNNIFYNSRSNNLSSGRNYAVYLTSASLTAFTINYNIYFTPGIGGTIGRFNGVDYTTMTPWMVAMFNDFNSGFGNPNFVSPDAPSSTLSLKVQSPTPAEGSGLLVSGITDDYEGDTRSSLSPTDIGADAGSYTGVDIFAPTISYTSLTNTSSLINRIISVSISDVGTGVRNTGSLQPRIFFRRWIPSTSAWFSTAGVLTAGNGNNGTWTFTIDYSLLGGSVVVGNYYQYYIVAQDSASPINLFYNPLAGTNHTNVYNQISPPTTPASFSIVTGLPTAISVGVGQTYTSLSGAGGLFSAINAGALSGNTVVTIVSDLTETAANTLTNSGMGGYTLKIVSDNNPHLISGSVTSGWGMVTINSANGVTIDGGVNRNLTFRNSSGITPTALTPVVWFYNGSNDTIRNCILEANNSSYGYGIMTISNASVASPCSGIVVSNNIIRPPNNVNTNPSQIGIYFASAAGNISNSTIGGITNSPRGNQISDYNYAGVYVTNAGNNITLGHPTDTVNGNVFYQTYARGSHYDILVGSGNNHIISSNRIFSSPGISHTGAVYSIYVFNNLNNITLNNNSIGGTASNRSGAAFGMASSFYGVLFNGGSIGSSTINNNSISNIAMSGATAFTGIQIGNGNVNVSNNVIGGFSVTANSYDVVSISQDFYGIRHATSSNLTLTNNIISDITNVGIGVTTAISVDAGVANITGNTIRNITTNLTNYSQADYACNGIRLATSTSGNNVSDNTIFNLTNSSNTGSTSICGIAVINPLTTSTIQRNRIYNLIATSTNAAAVSPIIWGIYISSTGSATYANNQISLTQSTANTQPRTRGIEIVTSGGTNNFYYNSIYLGGVATGANNTRSFLRNTSGSAALELKNNILFNERTGGGNTHFALSSSSTTSFYDDNNLFVTQAANLPIEYPFGTGISLASWNTVSGSPLYNIGNSVTQISSAQLFPNLINGDLSTNACRVSNAGVPVSITNDFTNQSRSVTTPDIGSVEFTTPSGMPSISVQPTTPAPVCVSGGSANFTLTATAYGISYQWYVNNGSGWTVLTNGGVYSGVTSSFMSVSNPTITYNNYRYRCQVNGICTPPVYSDSITLTVYPVTAVNTHPSASTICAGNNTLFVVAAVGANLTYQWQENQGAGFNNLSNGGSYSTVTDDTLIISNTAFAINGYTYRCVVTGTCGAATSNPASITVNQLPIVNTQASNSSICFGSNSGFSITASGTSISYQWQVNQGAGWNSVLNGVVYSNATTNSITLTVPPVSFNNYRYRCVVSGTCTPPANSDSVTLVVSAPTVKGAVSGGSNICSGSTSGLLTLSGQTGSVIRWESSISPYTSWTTISNTLTTYTSGVLSQNTAFRTVVQSGICTALNSDSTIVTVTPLVVKGAVSGGTSICSGSTSGLLTLSGHTGTVVRWESAVAPYSSWSTISNSLTTYTSGVLTQSTAFRAVVQSGSCGIANSDSTIVIVSPTTVAGSVSGGTTICSGTTSGTLTLSGQTGSIIRWESSVSPFTTWTTIANTISTYTSGTLTQTTQFRAVVQSGTCSSANSATTTVSVDPVSVGGSVTGGTTICTGSTSGLLTLSGQTGTILRWESSVSPFTTWTTISNTSATYTSGVLTQTTQYRAVVQSGVCSSANSATTTVTVSPATVAGSVSGGTTICTGSTSGLLTLSGNTGSVVRWESSVSPFTTWTTISSTSTTYTSGALTQNTQFRAVVQSGACSAANSSTTTVSVDPATVAGSVGGGTTICSGTTSGTLTLSGQTGSIVRWESSVSPFSSWTTIANTISTYTSGTLTQTTQFRAVVQSGACSSANSATTTVSVDPATVGGSVTGGANICTGSTSGLLTLSGNTGTVVRWESSISPFTTWTTISNTSTTYTSGALTQTTQFRAVVQSGVCSAANSATTSVTVSPATVAGSVSGGSSICSGSASGLLSLSGQTGSVIRWESSVSPYTSWSTIANTIATYTSGVLTQSTAFRAVVQNGVCNLLNADSTIVIVTPLVVKGAVSGGATICSGSAPGTLTLSGYTGTIVRWESALSPYTSWSTIANTANSYNTGALTQSTAYRAVVQSGSCGTANADSTVVIVNPTTVAGSVSGGTTICSSSTSGLLTLSGQTGSIVRWESSVSPFTTWTTIANTSATYTSGALTQTTQFRAVVQSGVCAAANSSVTTVTVNASGTWTGASSTAWNNTANWSCPQVPTSATNVIIPSVANAPLIIDAQQANNITIQSGGSLTLNNTASQLSIYGSLTNGGTFTNSNGMLVFTGSSVQTISAGTYNKIAVNNAAGVSLLGDIVLNDSLKMNVGNIALGKYKLTMSGTTGIVSNASATKYVITNDTGSLIIQNIGTAGRSGTVVFPVGSATSYTPITISNSTTLDQYYVRVSDSISEGGGNGSYRTSNVVNKKWFVYSGTTNSATLSFQWNASDELSGFNRGVGSYVAVNPVCSFGWCWNTVSTTGTNPYLKTITGGVKQYILSNLATYQGEYGIASNNALLPVNLITFTGTRNGQKVDLKWSTASELNNDHFILERSVDGVNFEFVAKVKGHGTTKSVSNYTNLDDVSDLISQLVSTVYYKLNQVDFDGKKTESGMVAVNILSTVNGMTMIAQPNPFSDHLHVVVNAEKVENITLKITDVTGKTLSEQTAKVLSGSNNIDIINIDALKSGLYFIHLISDEGIIIQKVLKAN